MPTAILLSEPKTWRNEKLPHYVVQAMPATGGSDLGHLLEQPCYQVTRFRRHEPCPGTSEFFTSGVVLPRLEALHAVRQHYTFANWSICRFASHLKGEYAADLIFEIDAHCKGFPGWFLDHEFYMPIVEAAANVGQRVFDRLVNVLGVDPKYITTCVTRMGSRVTVDWRAIGPRRLWTLLAVVRLVEQQVFAEGELKTLADDLKQKMILQGERLAAAQGEVFGAFDPEKITVEVKVDGSVYSKSDLPRPDPELGNKFRGPFIRPVGSLHSNSSPANMWVRTTPVPHEKFRPDNAAWLTSVSRTNKGYSMHDFAEPELFFSLKKWPEARDPRSDRAIEDDPMPCSELIRLFDEVDDAQDALSEDDQDEIKAVRRKAFGGRIRAAGETEASVNPEDARKIVTSLKEVKYQRGGRARAICPFCNKVPVSLTIYTQEGHGHCFRCNRSYNLVCRI